MFPYNQVIKLSCALLAAMKAHTRRNHLLEQLDRLHISLLEMVYDRSNTKVLLRPLRQRKNNDNVSAIKPAANTVLIGQRAATLLCQESTLESPQLSTLSPK